MCKLNSDFPVVILIIRKKLIVCFNIGRFGMIRSGSDLYSSRVEQKYANKYVFYFAAL